MLNACFINFMWNENSGKILYIHVSNIGYIGSLEPSTEGVLNNYPQFTFSAKKEYNVYPCKLQLSLHKVKFSGVSVPRAC